MDSKTRMNNLYTGKAIDRVPFIASATMFAGRLENLTSEEFYFDVEKSFIAQEKIIKKVGCDGSPCYDLPNGEVLDLGGSLNINKIGSVELPKVDHPIKSIEDALKYELPDIKKGLFLKKRIEFANYAATKGQKSCSISAGSPFTMVGSMVEASLFMKWLIKEKELVHNLLELAVKYLLEAADIFIEEFGVENCSASSNYPFENNDLVSPKVFEKFALPYMLKVHEGLRKRGIENFSIHLCGNQNKNLEFYKELKLKKGSFISSDEKNPLEKVADILGHDNIIAGNVPSALLIGESPKKVYESCVDIIKKMKHNEGGFVLMPSCDLPINAKLDNLKMMHKACVDYGSYK